MKKLVVFALAFAVVGAQAYADSCHLHRDNGYWSLIDDSNGATVAGPNSDLVALRSYRDASLSPYGECTQVETGGLCYLNRDSNGYFELELSSNNAVMAGPQADLPTLNSYRLSQLAQFGICQEMNNNSVCNLRQDGWGNYSLYTTGGRLMAGPNPNYGSLMQYRDQQLAVFNVCTIVQ